MPGRGNIPAARIRILTITSFLQEQIVPAPVIRAHNPNVDCSMKRSILMHDSALFHYSRPAAVLPDFIKQLHGDSVKRRILQYVLPVVYEFEREEFSPHIEQAEKNLISLPQFQRRNIFFVHPFELSLIAFDGVTFKTVSRVERHIFYRILPVHKGHNAPIPPGSQPVPRLLFHFTQETFFRTLSIFKMPSHTNPFILIYIIFFHCAMEHQILAVLFDIAQRAQSFHL